MLDNTRLLHLVDPSSGIVLFGQTLSHIYIYIFIFDIKDLKRSARGARHYLEFSYLLRLVVDPSSSIVLFGQTLSRSFIYIYIYSSLISKI